MMKIFSDDKKRLNQLRELVNSHGEIPISELRKSMFDQSVLDNGFVEDFDGDDKITKFDYLICSSWLMQGKPQDIEKYNRNRGMAPKATRLPSPHLVPKGDYVPSSSRIQDDELVEDLTEYTSDWNEDGDVDELDKLILACFLLQGKPSTTSEYNLQRMNYPSAVRLPNLVTANYTCDGEDCCDDDFDGDGKLTSKDALIYYAWSSLIDWDAKPDTTSHVDWYNQMAPQGFKFSPTKFPEMPCADFDEDGVRSSKDALIYYAWSSLIDWGAMPAGTSMSNWYEQQAPTGFKFGMKHAPVCVQETVETFVETAESPGETEGLSDECIGTEEMCIGRDPKVDWADYLIFYKWLLAGKCNTLECYNNQRESYPRACKLPFEMYEEIGSSVQQFAEVYSGEENL